MDLNKLKVPELRDLLKSKGLDSKGNKPVLIERLREAIERENGKYQCNYVKLDVNLLSYAYFFRSVVVFHSCNAGNRVISIESSLVSLYLSNRMDAVTLYHVHS